MEDTYLMPEIRRMDLGEAGNQSGELIAPGRVGSCGTPRDPTERRSILVTPAVLLLVRK
jgi:hypothetical protein